MARERHDENLQTVGGSAGALGAPMLAALSVFKASMAEV
jgi:hypothetical protein